MTKQFPPDPRRKARFREIARGIVFKDRSDRKYGLTVDTAGAIAQALERAYRDGAATLAPVPEQSDTGPVEWALIPPRPREGFWSICLAILGGDGSRSRDGHLAPALTERGTPGWAIVTEGRSLGRVIGERSIRPLIRLNLLDHAPDRPDHLILTERGRKTWLVFCQRGGRYPEDCTDI